jgi:uncharacterized protein YcfL
LIVLAALACLGCGEPRQAAVSDARRIVFGVYAICDTETHHLVYVTSSGLAVVPNGCAK